MEQRKKIFGALDDLMRSPIGDRLRERVFRELSTKEIHDLLQREQKPYKELMAYYQCALMEVETKFRVLNEQFSLAHDRNPIESIKTRVKSLESITEKLNRRNLPFSTQSIEENLTDIAGIRIICSFREDIYFLADCLLEQDDITLIQRKDYKKDIASDQLTADLKKCADESAALDLKMDAIRKEIEVLKAPEAKAIGREVKHLPGGILNENQ